MKKEKKKNMLKRYNEADTKKNVKYTAMKTGVDLVVGASAGAGLGALLGIWSPLAGFVMLGAGHYFGDKSGLLRVAGAATIAYGIAKAKENRAATTDVSVNGMSMGSLADGAKQRLINFKNDWMNAFFLDKLTGKKKEDDILEGDATVGAIDLSSMDVFDDMNKDMAVNFELEKIRQEDEEEEFNVVIESEEEDFEEEDLESHEIPLLEEEFDFNNF